MGTYLVCQNRQLFFLLLVWYFWFYPQIASYLQYNFYHFLLKALFLSIFCSILYRGKFWVLIVKHIFKEFLYILNIGLVFCVFGILAFKMECSCFVIRSFSFSSTIFLFIAALDFLMVSVLNFLYLSVLFNYCCNISVNIFWAI